MLVGNVLEKTDAACSWQICADKLADWVRNSWLEHEKWGVNIKPWEDATFEEAAALPGLREEGFYDLVGVDYILKWWGGEDPEELSGELDVIWKLARENGDGSVLCYRSWIKLAPRDFLLALYKQEGDKRETNRTAFREAFAQWRELFRQMQI